MARGKRFIRLLVLIAVLALVAAACSSSSDDATTTTAASGGEATTTTVAPAPGGDFTFGMILVGPENDRGWSQDHFEAVK
jgi:simple sugar transport system substrate-binding protein